MKFTISHISTEMFENYYNYIKWDYYNYIKQTLVVWIAKNTYQEEHITQYFSKLTKH